MVTVNKILETEIGWVVYFNCRHLKLIAQFVLKKHLYIQTFYCHNSYAQQVNLLCITCSGTDPNHWFDSLILMSMGGESLCLQHCHAIFHWKAQNLRIHVRPVDWIKPISNGSNIPFISLVMFQNAHHHSLCLLALQPSCTSWTSRYPNMLHLGFHLRPRSCF